MKTALLCLSFLVVTVLSAQPTLTFPFNENLIGTSFNVNYGFGFNEGPSGSNITWDFSNENFPTPLEMNIVDPGSTPFSDSHPNADLAIINNLTASTQYDFYDFSPQGVLLIGEESEGSSTTTYTDPRLLLPSSLDYLDSFEDSLSYQTTINDNTSLGESSMSVEADGYGTLITPEDTYENVLRIHIIERLDVILNPETPNPIIVEIDSDTYAWIIDGFPIPVMLTREIDSDGFPASESSYLSGDFLSTYEMNSLKGVSLYPVPTFDFVNLDLGDNQTGTATVRIFDVRGALIKEFTQGIAQVTRFDVSDLPSGFYSLNIQMEEGMATKHFTK